MVRSLETLDVSQNPWVEYTVASSASHHALVKERAAFPGPQPAKEGKTVTFR
jgi:hypothetical protein